MIATIKVINICIIPHKITWLIITVTQKKNDIGDDPTHSIV